MTAFGRLTVVKKSGAEGGTCQMKEPELLIGRDQDQCDIQIRLPEVSKVQAKLVADEVHSGVWAENCSVTNPMGTLLNGAPLSAKRLLADGDVLAICGRSFRFEYATDDNATTVVIPAASRAAALKVETPKQAEPAAHVVKSVKKSPHAPSSGAKKENQDVANMAAPPPLLAAVAAAAAAAAAARAVADAVPADKPAPSERSAGRTPLVDQRVRSALKARRSMIAGETATPSPGDALSDKKKRRKSSVGTPKAALPLQPAAPIAPPPVPIATDGAPEAPLRLPAALMAAIAMRAKASPKPAKSPAVDSEAMPPPAARSRTPTAVSAKAKTPRSQQRAPAPAEPMQVEEEDLGVPVYEPPVQKLLGVGSLPPELSVRASLPAAVRGQIALRRRSSVGAAPTPVKARVDSVSAAPAALPSGLRSAIKVRLAGSNATRVGVSA
jgi:hypothetical protein